MTKWSALFLLFFLFLGNATANSPNETKIYIDLWSSTLFLLEHGKVVEQYKISGGMSQSPTPIGTFKIVEKSKGWGGGFGSRWLGLDVPWGKYGIHGTNKPWLIGQDVSSGCIRMFNDDVEKLFDRVPIGTIVHIDGPITGVDDGELKNLSEGSKGTLVQMIQQQLKARGYYSGAIDGKFDREVEEAVRKFQKENKLPVTGGITSVEYNLLGILE